MARKQQDNAPAPAAQPAYKVVKREKDRWWEVRDPRGELVCETVYKRGAVEVVRRLIPYRQRPVSIGGTVPVHVVSRRTVGDTA